MLSQPCLDIECLRAVAVVPRRCGGLFRHHVGKLLEVDLECLLEVIVLAHDVRHAVRPLLRAGPLLGESAVQLADSRRVEVGRVHFDLVRAEQHVECLEASLDKLFMLLSLLEADAVQQMNAIPAHADQRVREALHLEKAVDLLGEGLRLCKLGIRR